MGADGGSIPDRRDLVKTKGKAAKTDKALLRERFIFCALSRKPLAKPVVADQLGKLYNKDAVLEYLLDRTSYGDGDQICRYVRSVKDLLTLNLMPNPAASADTPSSPEARAPFVCWLTMKEMTGAVPFIALRPCGCVFSEAAVRSIVPNLTRGPGSKEAKDTSPQPAPATETAACPNCTKPFDPTATSSVLPINPEPKVEEALFEALLTARAAAKADKASKKRKAVDGEEKERKKDKKEKKDRKDKADSAEKAEAKSQRLGSGSPAPGSAPGKPSSVSRSVQGMLAEQEKKRLAAQANMSDAVKSMFRSKTEGKASDNADFFGRTFNRYAA